ncbi:hypothetical protein DID74_02470, partial [Candidatus Marinamargulisbacteria bacterium SCGC AG-333-B06]
PDTSDKSHQPPSTTHTDSASLGSSDESSRTSSPIQSDQASPDTSDKSDRPPSTTQKYPYEPKSAITIQSYFRIYRLKNLINEKINKIPIDNHKELTKMEYNSFCSKLDKQPKISYEDKLKSLKIFLKCTTYENLPPILKEDLFENNGKLLKLCYKSLHSILGHSIKNHPLVSTTAPNKDDYNLFSLKTPKNPNVNKNWENYKNAIEKLKKNGITVLQGRNDIHIPWSLTASKCVMSIIDSARIEALAAFDPDTITDTIEARKNEINVTFKNHVNILSNCITNLVIWAVTVDDVPDTLSQELPQEIVQALLNALKLIADVNARRQKYKSTDLATNPENIFSYDEKEKNQILEWFENDIAKHTITKPQINALQEYISVAYESFHAAWQSFEKTADKANFESEKMNLIIDFQKIMTSFQTALNINYEPEKKDFAEISFSTNSHYGMHMVIFHRMASILAKTLNPNFRQEDSQYLPMYEEQSLLSQQCGSIANHVATYQRELDQWDFGSGAFGIIFSHLKEKAQKEKKNVEAIKDFNQLKENMSKISNLKKEKREIFIAKNTSSSSPLDQKQLDEASKVILDEQWKELTSNTKSLIYKHMPNFNDVYDAKYCKVKAYDSNQTMSYATLIFFWLNLGFKGKL